MDFPSQTCTKVSVPPGTDTVNLFQIHTTCTPTSTRYRLELQWYHFSEVEVGGTHLSRVDDHCHRSLGCISILWRVPFLNGETWGILIYHPLDTDTRQPPGCSHRRRLVEVYASSCTPRTWIGVNLNSFSTQVILPATFPNFSSQLCPGQIVTNVSLFLRSPNLVNLYECPLGTDVCLFLPPSSQSLLPSCHDPESLMILWQHTGLLSKRSTWYEYNLSPRDLFHRSSIRKQSTDVGRSLDIRMGPTRFTPQFPSENTTQYLRLT